MGLLSSFCANWSASMGVTALNTQGSLASLAAMVRNATWLCLVRRLSTVVPGFMVKRTAMGSPPKTFS